MRGGNLTIELLALCATALRDLGMGYQHKEITANSGQGLDVLLADVVAHLRGLGIDDEGGWDCEATRGFPVAAGDQSSLAVPVPACPEDADDASQEMNAWRAQIGAEILKAHTRMKGRRAKPRRRSILPACWRICATWRTLPASISTAHSASRTSTTWKKRRCRHEARLPRLPAGARVCRRTLALLRERLRPHTHWAGRPLHGTQSWRIP